MIRLHQLLTGKLRSAALTAAAIAVVGGTTALAASVPLVVPRLDPAKPHLHTSASPSAEASPEAKESPEAKPSESPDPTPPVVVTSPSANGTHGDCVSKVAQDHSAVAKNKNGKETHGAAVSQAAHECGKSGDDNNQDGNNDQKDSNDSNKPEPAESPEPKPSPEPSESPEPKESPEAGDANGG
jgi:hypothetical protein